MKINDIYEVTILDENNLASGISKINNFVVFVPNALKNEELEIKITEVHKKYAIGKILKILKKSPYRTTPNCPYYESCGGCSFGHTSYKNELEIKENYLNKLFNTNKKIHYDIDYNYRNKVILHVENNKIGFYQEKTNKLIEIDKCNLLNDKINEVIKTLKKINLTNIKEITIKYTINNSEMLISFDNTISISDINFLIKKFPIIKSIYCNNKLVIGNPYITETINNIKYLINHLSFFQVNTNMMINLYNQIKKFKTKNNTLLDLYCGVGSIGIFLNKEYKKILGIEIIKEAIDLAKQNLLINNINNVTFICGDAKNIHDKYETIIVDPPRNGLSNEVIKNILEINPKEIIYVSCNPITLKRDINNLTNYTLKDIEYFEMFPHTIHVECVSLLHRKDLEK